MRKHASLYLLMISLLANLSVAEAGIVRAVDASPPPEAQAAGIASYVLPNGFKIILASYPSAPNARIELVVKTGSKMEGYGETGAAHLLEHMLFKGAGDRASVKSGLTKIGARFNANTAADRTSYFEILPSEPDLIDEAINIEADRFARASFTREDLASEMTVVRNELDQKDSAPGSVLLRAVERQSFFWHGYGRPTIGARSDIEGAPFEVLKSFYNKHYRPDNAFLLVSGNFDKKRVLALASKVFAAVPNPAAPKITSWTRDEARSVTTRSEVFLPTGNAMAMSAWKIPAAYDRQNIALSLASSAICSNDWGSLRKDLLMGRKLATSVSCSGLDRRDAGLFFVVANAGANDDVEVLSRVLHQHVESAAASGITQDQLDRSRQEQLHAFERIGSSHDAFATLLSDAEVCGDWRLAFWQLDTIKAITLEEANAALGRWLVSTNRSDALLRRADGKSAPELPKVEDPIARVAGKDWPVVSRQGDPLPQTASELAAATIHIPLDGKDAQAVLISRKTQGDLAWLAFTNDFGNEGALSGRFAACDMASSLFMFGGANMSRDQLDRELEKLQANWDIGMDQFSIEAPRSNMQAALKILLSVWSQPTMAAGEFERRKAAAIAGTEAGLREPASVASNVLELRFDNYPDKHPKKSLSIAQTLASLQALTLGEVLACQADFAGLSRVRLALVGDFSVDDVKALWADLARIPSSTVPYERVKAYAPPGKIDTSPINVTMPGSPNASIAGASLIRMTDSDADFPALRIATNILGGNMASRIWNRLRESDGLAYSSGAALIGSVFDPRSSFSLYASADSDKAEVALASLQDELAKALENGFTEEEVDREKKTWIQERRRFAGNEASLARRLVQQLKNGRDFSWMANYDQQIANSSVSDINAAFRKYIGSAPMVWMLAKSSK